MSPTNLDRYHWRKQITKTLIRESAWPVDILDRWLISAQILLLIKWTLAYWVQSASRIRWRDERQFTTEGAAILHWTRMSDTYLIQPLVSVRELVNRGDHTTICSLSLAHPQVHVPMYSNLRRVWETCMLLICHLLHVHIRYSTNPSKFRAVMYHSPQQAHASGVWFCLFVWLVVSCLFVHLWFDTWHSLNPRKSFQV